jgi:hypothetical protein
MNKRAEPDSLGFSLIAAGCFSAAGFPPVERSMLFALAGIASLTVAVQARRSIRLPLATFLAVSISTLSTLTSDIARIPDVSGAVFILWLIPPLFFAALWMVRRSARLPAIAGPALAALIALVGLLVMADTHGADTGVDVYFSHIEAAEAISNGQDPYGEAVRVFDGRPGSTDEVIIGYSYPPATMLPYVASHLAVGDPRWVNIVAWLLVVGAVAWRTMVRGDRASLAVLITLSSFGAWRLVIFTGWTEPLTIALLTVAALVWKRPLWSAVLLGLGLATKQYLVLLAPILLLANRQLGRRRLATSLVVTVATFIPSAVIDTPTMLDALVFRFLRQGYRPDTLSLPALLDSIGLEPRVPIVIAIVIVALVSLWLRQSVRDGATLMTAAALVLACFFVLTQALTNYWFLVAALALIGGWLSSLGGRNSTAPVDLQHP